MFAESSLKKLHDPAAALDGAIRTAVEALYDAADDDTATGGPDLIRHIYPVVVSDHRATVPCATPTPTSARSPRPW